LSSITIAVSAYPIEPFARLSLWKDKLSRWCEEAARNDAGIVVFPEYAAMEACSVFGEDVSRDLLVSTQRLQAILPELDEWLGALARRLGLVILGPSAPRSLRTDGAPPWTNAALLFLPDGHIGRQEKRILTPWDISPWGLSPGSGQTVFETPAGAIGIAICYDVEFPLQVRRLAEAGADIILTPACTDTAAGACRVQLAARARALENQCVVALSPTVGTAAWSPALDVNTGAAGVFCPPDRGMPADGVVALGGMNTPGWTYGRINLEAIRELRASGEVRTVRDWPLQDRP
jgi:predicted amidohydrolase